LVIKYGVSYLEFSLKPGERPGTKFEFEDVGGQDEDIIKDLNFVLEEASFCYCIEAGY
jgi:hypothetical protein